ncbi:DoxX family membrane protein [Chitinophaga sp. CB10]|uniref:DoxX family membrane protein n=1 Tax=Chitinophaga sp. CB10 TaxID=1891659 RepID=UPI000A6D8F62|nr:DoxX family membrane protein [Chitinophaga sp. CB10]
MATITKLQETLRFTYGIVPIVAGLDKFTNLLTRWSDYLGNNARLIPFDPEVFMKAVGIIEIIAGILVLVRPRIGAYIVMAWLLCIAASLIVGGHYFDVAVRDIVMAIGAYTLAQLTQLVPSNNK